MAEDAERAGAAAKYRKGLGSSARRSRAVHMVLRITGQARPPGKSASSSILISVTASNLRGWRRNWLIVGRLSAPWHNYGYV